MRNYVIINGTNSLTIPGLAIRELPAISKTLMRNQKEEIDGRDGDIITELGYSAYDKTMTIGLYGSYDINQIIAFFNQKGTIVFSNEPDKYYNFTILEKIDYDKLVKFRTASVRIHCQPFKYPVSETPVEIEAEYVTATGEDITLNNTTTAPLEIDLKGNTYQETTTGKNLCNPTSHLAVFGSGYVTASATLITSPYTTAQNYRGVSFIAKVEANKTYVISSDISLTSKYAVGIYNSEADVTTSSNIIEYIGGVTSTFTPTHSGYAVIGKAASDSGTTITWSWIQVELGSTATDYEPYTNGVAPNTDFPMPVQVVTGDNTIKVVGKNLLDKTQIVSGNTNNWTVTQIENGITLACLRSYSTGQPTLDLNVKPNTKYTFSYTLSNANVGIAISIDNTNWQYGTTTGSNTVTTSSAGIIYLKFSANAETSGDLTYIQLEESTTPSTYTPYQSQEYEINLGKNLFDIQDLVKGRLDNGVIGYETNTTDLTLNADSFSFTTNANYRGVSTNSYIPIKPNTTYYYKSDTIRTGTTTGIACYDDSKTYLSNPTTTAVDDYTVKWTTPANARYCRMQIQLSASGTITITKPQLQQDKISDYSPYFTPIELCKIGTYQDYLYKSGENWYKHKEIEKITFIGNEAENWSKYTNTDSQGNTYGFSISLPNTPLQVTNVSNFALSNYFRQNNRNAVSVIDTRGIYLGSGDTFFLKIDQSLVSGGTTTNLKTWLSNHNTDVYYVLSTPTEEQITNAELIEQLNDILNAVSYEDQTNISQENDNLPFILDISALKKGTDMAVVNNEGNITSKPIIAVKGNGTLGIYLDNTQMFSLNMTSDITIDTENMEAYDPNTSQLRNRQVTGDYSKFALQPGNNTIKVTGDFTSVTISKYKRWL